MGILCLRMSGYTCILLWECIGKENIYTYFSAKISGSTNFRKIWEYMLPLDQLPQKITTFMDTFSSDTAKLYMNIGLYRKRLGALKG
jgi:ABC-type polysaccharide transport system permease subunit